MEDPIAATLSRSFHNGSYRRPGQGHTYNDGKGLMRGGCSSATKHLDLSLQMASKKSQICNNSIEFDAPVRYGGDLDSLCKSQSAEHTTSPKKQRIILLNPNRQSQGDAEVSKVNHGPNKSNPESVPRPKITFFPQSDVHVGYRSIRGAGAGMINVGNTCYLNSTLQALFHTPALFNYLTMNKSNHISKCRSSQGNGFVQCILCAMMNTLNDTMGNNSAIRPSRIYGNLKAICKHMVQGRQEDAHEFLRYLIESLQRSYLMAESIPFKSLDTASKETTPFNQIFGGYMRQDVTCLRCKYVSTTFQHFMDLLLDIRQVSTIQDALEQHFRQERIGGNGENADSMYKCEKCNVKVPAKKRCLIERPPAVLCIQLKRFSLMGGKISKPVLLSQIINVSQFINSSQSEVKYKLVSMITHVGSSPNCGHYTAIGEAKSGQFYQFDDASVRPIPVTQAMNTASYVVFYEMTRPCWEIRVRPQQQNGNQNRIIGPQQQQPQQQNGIQNRIIGPQQQQQNGNQNLIIGPQQQPQQNGNQNRIIGPQQQPQQNGHQNRIIGPQQPFQPKIIPLNGSTISKANLMTTFSSPVNRLGVVAAKVKQTMSNLTSASSSSAPLASAKPAINGCSTSPKMIGLVPYDDDDDSDTDSKPSSSASELLPVVVTTSQFVPRSVTMNAMKKVDDEQKNFPPNDVAPSAGPVAVQKSASGNWTVIDVDHHNPSITSDGSCGSTTGNWIVMPSTKVSIEIAKPVPKVWTVTPIKKAEVAIAPSSSVNGTQTLAASDKTEIKLANGGGSLPQAPVRPVIREPFSPGALSRKRGSVDDTDDEDYDKELDRGRTKKVRKAITAPDDERQTDNKGNIFQLAQEKQNQRRNSGYFGRDRYHHDQSRSRSFDDRGRRNSYGGPRDHDYRDKHHYPRNHQDFQRNHSHSRSYVYRGYEGKR